MAYPSFFLQCSLLSTTSVQFLIPRNWFTSFLRASSHLFLGPRWYLLPSKVMFIIFMVFSGLDWLSGKINEYSSRGPRFDFQLCHGIFLWLRNIPEQYGLSVHCPCSVLCCLWRWPLHFADTDQERFSNCVHVTICAVHRNFLPP